MTRKSLVPAGIILAVLLLYFLPQLSLLNAQLRSVGKRIKYRQAFYNLAASVRLKTFAFGSHHAPLLKWKRKISGSILGVSLRDDGGEIYVSSGSVVTSLGIDGRRNWSKTFPSIPTGMAVSKDGEILYVAGADTHLFALNRSAGILWTRSFPHWTGIFSVSSSVDGKFALVVSSVTHACSQQGTIVDVAGSVQSSFSVNPIGNGQLLNALFSEDGKYILSLPWNADDLNSRDCHRYDRDGLWVSGDFAIYNTVGKLVWTAKTREWAFWEYSNLNRRLHTESFPGPEWRNYFNAGVSTDGLYAFSQDRIYDIEAGKTVWQTTTPKFEASVVYSDEDGFIVQSWGIDIGAPAKLTRVGRDGAEQWTVPVYGHSVYCRNDSCFVPRISLWSGCDVYNSKTGRRTGYIDTDLEKITQATDQLVLGESVDIYGQIAALYLHERSGRLVWLARFPINFRTHEPRGFGFRSEKIPDWDVYSSPNLKHIIVRNGDELSLYGKDRE